MVGKLVADRYLWNRLSKAGKALVAERYSADRMYNQYRGILSSLSQHGHTTRETAQ
jgi:hypothetical protein